MGESKAVTRTYRIATFCDPGEQRRSWINTYTLWYDESWPRCIAFEVEATSTEEARKMAIDMRLERERSTT